MYNIKYVSDNGKTINFSPLENFVITDIDGLTANSVSIAASQGIGQVGTTIQGKSVNDKMITIEGSMLGPSKNLRQRLIDTIVPLVSGKLIYDNKYVLDVEPETTPDITRESHNAQFQLVLRAPYPYWRSIEQSLTKLTGIEPHFRFPVNYGNPKVPDYHIFGKRIEEAYQVIYNNGNVPIPFLINFYAKTALSNPKILNLKTLEFIRMEKNMVAGEVITIDMTGNTLDIVSTVGEVSTNAFGYFDIDSTLFNLEIGDNLIKSEADVNENGLYSTIFYNITTAGVYGNDATYL